MGRTDHNPVSFSRRPDVLQKKSLALLVQTVHRLVQHQNRRIHGQHRGQRHPFLLPAAEVEGRPVPDPAQSEHLNVFLHPVPDFLFRQPQLGRPEQNLVFHAGTEQLNLRILKYEADLPVKIHPEPRVLHGLPADLPAVEQIPAFRGIVQPQENPEQGGFPAAVRSLYGVPVSPLKCVIQMIQNETFPVTETYVIQCDHSAPVPIRTVRILLCFCRSTGRRQTLSLKYTLFRGFFQFLPLAGRTEGRTERAAAGG